MNTTSNEQRPSIHAFLLLVPALAGCATMEAKIEIAASPERVWQVLTDLDAYPAWNPFFIDAAGDLQVDSELRLVMEPEGKEPMTFEPRLLEVVPYQQIVWRGRLLVPGLFDGVHRFSIEPLGNGRVLFRQHESFSGLFVPFVSFKPFLAGWEKMNAALKLRAERAE